MIFGLLGAGLSIFGGLSQARMQRNQANFNRMIAESNAGFNLRAEMDALQLDEIQSQMALQDAQFNYFIVEKEIEARQENALRLRQFAEARTTASREEIRRKRADFERFQSSQRSSIAASGVTEQGSPLELLVETAGKAELALDEMQREINYERRDLIDRAYMEERDAGVAGIMANLSLKQSGFGNEMAAVSRNMQRVNANQRYEIAKTGAAYQQAQGYAQSRATLYQAGGSLLSSVSSWLGQRDRENYLGMSKGFLR